MEIDSGPAVNSPSLETFHAAASKLDYTEPLESLLAEFRQGAFADRERTHEDAAIRSHLSQLHAAWDRVLPKFPDQPWKRRTGRWEYHRGRRDAYLKRILVACMRAIDGEGRTVVNPATVFGRHARALASELPDHEVVGTDIEPGFNRLYRLVSWWTYPRLQNYRFVRENVFEPDPGRRPAAVIFFGACGSVTDGCMDYAIGASSPFLLFRACCHDNIGGNTQIVKRPGKLNHFFRWKNRVMARIKQQGNGVYFSPKYFKDAYPRSTAARDLMDSDTIIEIARNSVDSDICRSLIDLDRCLFLQENGYDVLYREELFFAHRRH